jgi:hypothetical protein
LRKRRVSNRAAKLKVLREKRRQEVSALHPGDPKPKRVSFGWNKTLREVRKDPNMPLALLKADEALRE